MVAVLHVLDERVDDAVGIDRSAGEPNGEVEEVAALAALVEGAKVRGQQFVERIRVDSTVAPEPPRVDYKRLSDKAMNCEVLSRIDLDLKSKQQGGHVLGVEAVDKGDAPFRLLPFWLTQPGVEDIAQRRQDRPGWFRLYLH